jgi:UDP-glucose 4-epimerase
MQRILVTGGAGYIGSKIATDLIKEKYKVYIIDNLSTGHKILINKKAIFLKCCIGNKKKVNYFIKKNKITSIIHCAASLDVNESEKKPHKYFINNFVNTKKLLEVCIKNNLKNFIFSSTCAVYGNVSGKVSEATMPKPSSVYGKTKLQCENIIKIFSKKYNFNYGILRYFNVAGSDIPNKIGCINKNNQLIKNISLSITNKKNKISVFGSNYKTKDGTCVRDYIHLEDISTIHSKLLKIISNKNTSYLLNCGYGVGYSVLEIINNYEKFYRIKLDKFFLPRRKGDVANVVSSTKKMNQILKIKFNKKIKLKKIINSSVDWEKFLQKYHN